MASLVIILERFVFNFEFEVLKGEKVLGHLSWFQCTCTCLTYPNFATHFDRINNQWLGNL